MDKLSRVQRAQLNDFMSFTSTDENTALVCLGRTKWNIERAADYYYQNAHYFMSRQPTRQIPKNGYGKEMFTKYANHPRDDVGADRIGPNGIMELLNDLRMEATDRKVLILAWQFKAETQCEFSREEWTNGMTQLNCNSASDLRAALDNLNGIIENDRLKFREMYQFAFNYGKPSRQRNIDCETAIAYWKIMFKERYVLLDKWEEFLRKENHKIITRDAWNLVFEFFETINPDLSNYDEDGAWPTILDSFTEFLKEQRS